MPSPPGRGHFLGLDFLRGIAALSVFVFHWLAFQNYVSLGFLGVDFFFMLSGFVVAYAYEARLLNGMGLGDFCRVRLVRLYPMVLLGIALGAAHGLLRDALVPAEAPPGWVTGLAVTANLFMVPVDLNGYGHGLIGMYPLNGALWSLFFELAANFAYAAFIRHLTLGRLGLVVALGFAGLCFMASHPGAGGAFMRGASIPEMGYGLIRVTFAYFVGVMLFRWRQRWAWMRGWGAPPVVLGACLLGLALPASAVPAALQMAVIALGFPAIILLGANRMAQGPIYGLLGRLSYPFYVLHIPIMLTAMGFLKWRHLYDVPWAGWYGLPVAAAIGLAAWLALRFYDEPVRRAMK